MQCDTYIVEVWIDVRIPEKVAQFVVTSYLEVSRIRNRYNPDIYTVKVKRC